MNKKILPLAISAMLLNNYDAMAVNVRKTPSDVMIAVEVNQAPKDSLPAIEKGVRKVIAKQLHIEEGGIRRTSDLIKDLGADSLDIVEIVMSLENKYNISFSDDELNKIKKVSDIVTVIGKRKK